MKISSLIHCLQLELSAFGDRPVIVRGDGIYEDGKPDAIYADFDENNKAKHVVLHIQEAQYGADT